MSNVDREHSTAQVTATLVGVIKAHGGYVVSDALREAMAAVIKAALYAHYARGYRSGHTAGEREALTINKREARRLDL